MMPGVELWMKTYKNKWFKDAYAWASKLGLRPQSLSPIPEDGLWELALSVVQSYVPRGSWILDAGSGTADFSYLLSTKGYKVIAVEINPRMIEIARVYLPPSGLMTVVRGDFTKMWMRVKAIVMLNASWSEELPEWWEDKLVITDAWWNGLDKRILVINKGKVVNVVSVNDRNNNVFGEDEIQLHEGSLMERRAVE